MMEIDIDWLYSQRFSVSCVFLVCASSLFAARLIIMYVHYFLLHIFCTVSSAVAVLYLLKVILKVMRNSSVLPQWGGESRGE